MAGVYAVIGSFGMMTIISVGFAAMTKTIIALTPKSLEELTKQALQCIRRRKNHRLLISPTDWQASGPITTSRKAGSPPVRF